MSEVSRPADPQSPDPQSPDPQSPDPQRDAADAGTWTAASDADIERVLERINRFPGPDAVGVPSWAAEELTFGQLRLLFLLGSHGPAPMSRIAEWLRVGLPTASGIVERVERHGFVERRHRSDDRRIVECLLTDEGRRLMRDIVGTRSEAVRRMLRVLSADELAVLDHLLEVVIDRTASKAP